jgi:hypothetical protein
MSLLVSGGGASYGSAAPTLVTSGKGTASTASAVSAQFVPTGDGIVIAIICIEGSGVTSSSISGVATSSGTTVGSWTKYSNYTIVGQNGWNVVHEVWWIKGLASGGTIGATATTVASGFDDATMVLLYVSGCNQTAPFDINSSLPVNTNFPAASTSRVITGISTNSYNILLIGSVFTNYNNTAINGYIDTGWTQAQFVQNTGAVLYMYNFVEYQSITGSIQSGSTLTLQSGSQTGNWGAVVFALTA